MAQYFRVNMVNGLPTTFKPECITLCLQTRVLFLEGKNVGNLL